MSFVQGLFWNNLSTSEQNIRTQSFIDEVYTKTFLKNRSKFFFVFTGTGEISLEGLPIEIKNLTDLKESTIDIYLYEPISYSFKSTGYNLGYYSEFPFDLNSSEDLISTEFESLEELSRQIKKPLKVYHGDYGVEKIFANRYPNLYLRCLDLALKLPTRHMFDPGNSKKIINKKFWCGNRRYTVHRHLIMSYLVNKLGNYSWRFFIDKRFDPYCIPWLDQDLKKFIADNRPKLNSKNFNLEFETKKIVVKNHIDMSSPDGEYNSPNPSYIDTVRECFCSVVTETRFAQPTGNFSEKTTDAINFENPFVLVAPPRTLEYMKKLNFKTFDRWWDESYDQEQDHPTRIKRIFETLNYINSLSLADLNSMYQEMIPIIHHNKKILKRFPFHGRIIK